MSTETSLISRNGVGLGFASHVDHFQAGREAAQMALRQLSGNDFQMVLAFGPHGPHFKDFIEGVRLVTGENNLIGIPNKIIVSNEVISEAACVVAIFQGQSNNYSISSASVDGDNYLSAITSLLTQIRIQRGNLIDQYEHRGLFLFDNYSADNETQLPRTIGAETGLESWMVKTNPHIDKNSPLMCQEQILTSGLVGIECLSERPWGLGQVNIEAFKNHPKVYQEATNTAFRDAKKQMDPLGPAFGFFFFNFDTTRMTHQDLNSLFMADHSIFDNLPIVGVEARYPFVKWGHGSDLVTNESIMALLVPK